jgi:hypothetical protein
MTSTPVLRRIQPATRFVEDPERLLTGGMCGDLARNECESEIGNNSGRRGEKIQDGSVKRQGMTQIGMVDL